MGVRQNSLFLKKVVSLRHKKFVTTQVLQKKEKMLEKKKILTFAPWKK
jgi:hypothetical protein